MQVSTVIDYEWSLQRKMTRMRRHWGGERDLK